MPNAEEGCTDLKSIFLDHIFKGNRKRFSWKLTAALTGAHTIGQAHKENSGFQGTWSDSKNQGVFNNDYYKSLILKGWAPKVIDADHHQWVRVDLAPDPSSAIPQMMLSSDICLAYQNNEKHADCVKEKMDKGMSEQRANGKCKTFQKKGELINGAVDCCAWTNTRALFNSGTFKG
jgi:hypothetical protein